MCTMALPILEFTSFDMRHYRLTLYQSIRESCLDYQSIKRLLNGKWAFETQIVKARSIIT